MNMTISCERKSDYHFSWNNIYEEHQTIAELLLLMSLVTMLEDQIRYLILKY